MCQGWYQAAVEEEVSWWAVRLYKETLCFDDILLVPQKSNTGSRHDIDLSTTIGVNAKITLKLPIIAAPMDTVCEWQMALMLGKLGGLGIIHRYMHVDDQAAQVARVAQAGVLVGAAIGAKGGYVDHAYKLVKAGAKVILVDTANGHNINCIIAVSELRRVFPNTHIMAGNVSTWQGFYELQNAGVDSVRVGIGGGAVCTTRIVTGHGMPTLSSIMDVNEGYPVASIIADGGIRNSGDAVKALAAGANAVMLGSALAGTDESPGNKFIQDGSTWKVFRGMASKEAQETGRGTVSIIEGVSTRVPYIGNLENIIDDWKNGIKSGLSYSGVDDLIELRESAQYVKVSPLSTHESRPHAKV